jgi:hypothetical protein
MISAELAETDPRGRTSQGHAPQACSGGDTLTLRLSPADAVPLVRLARICGVSAEVLIRIVVRQEFRSLGLAPDRPPRD